MNKHEIKQRYTDIHFLDRFTQLYSLKIFFSRCVISSDYEVSREIGQLIVLTPAGQELFNSLSELNPTYPKVELILSIFVAFSHDDLFVDVINTNIEGISALLNKEVLNKAIKYPWIYERTVYDYFSKLRDDRPDWLSYEEAAPILEKTPIGVFQVNKFIIGPFGLLESKTRRYMSPTRNVPLWHCSDPACEKVHFVEMRSGDHRLLSLSLKVFELCRSSKESDWQDFYIENLSGEPEWYDEKHFDQLPNLIINCFSERELKQIFIKVITDYPEDIRKFLPRAIAKKGSPVNIAECLGKNQIFQLLLLVSNVEIANSIEELINSNIIKIPVTELRASRFTYKRLTAYNITCQCSRFGIRAIPRNRNISTILLKNLINELYSDEEELAWKLRHCEGHSNTDKLERYLNNTDPKDIVAEFILNSKFFTTRTFNYLGCGKFSLPKNEKEEEFLIEKILWKLGFDIGLYPNEVPLYWERLNKFCDTTRTHIGSTENDKEMIRSSAVNFFVSLEQVLDYSLSFSTWLLFIDHYSNSEFKFNLKKAQKFTANFLNSRQADLEEKIVYDENGKNTLYPLIQGFKLLADQVNKAIINEVQYIRSPGEFPSFYGRSNINKFPFLHNILLLDLSPEDIKNTVYLFELITHELTSANVCSVRNKIEHKRDDFPTTEEIEQACAALERITRKMQDAGVLPTIYLYSGLYKDEYGRGYDKLVNHEGDKIEIFTQNQYRSKLPSNNVPQIVVPSIRLNKSIEPLRFAYKEDSDFVNMWIDFPKVRENVQEEFVRSSEDEYQNIDKFQAEQSIS
ncbi:MAG: hypothetical protein J7639_03545 [Paenibacillaceae bacterium]|nr:hypothetical protein [Paenibacillaceae bacterium]